MSTQLFAQPSRFTIARCAAMMLLVGIAIALQASPVFAQDGQTARPAKPLTQPPMDTSPKPWTGKFLPDGQPDVMGGTWANTFGGTGRLDNPYAGGNTDPNAPLRPSRIIDPPDGKIPYQPWADALQRAEEKHVGNPTKPEHIDTQARCLPGGIPRLNYYVGNATILQTPGFVTFLWDRFHIYRVIRLDNAPRLAPNVKLWMGDARGHWDGNTLVVETTNYSGKHRLTSQGDFMSENSKITERYVFLTPDRIAYEVTITDPTVYTRPWTMRVEQKRSMPKGYEAEIWEAACWEGNMQRPGGIEGLLEANTK